VIYFIGIILTHLFLSCERSNSKESHGNEFLKSVEIYRYNYRDEKYCENCIESNFLTAIPAYLVQKPDNLILASKNKHEMKTLNSSLHTIEYSKKTKNNFNHNFIIAFKYVTGKKTIYSKLSNGEWLVNDSVIIKPKKDILEIIRMYVNQKDLTDYERVTRGPIALPAQ
jgi:hypothetical protein